MFKSKNGKKNTPKLKSNQPTTNNQKKNSKNMKTELPCSQLKLKD